MSAIAAFRAPHLFFPCPPEGAVTGLDFVLITETQACELRFLLEDLELTFTGTATMNLITPPSSLDASFEETMTMSSGVSSANFWEVNGDAGDASSFGGGTYPRVPTERVCPTGRSGVLASPAFSLYYSMSKASGGIGGGESGSLFLIIRSVGGSLRLYYGINGEVGRSDGVLAPGINILNPSATGTIFPSQIAANGTVSIAGVSLEWVAKIHANTINTTSTLTGAGITLTPTYYTPA
jgi:hypothetical protein